MIIEGSVLGPIDSPYTENNEWSVLVGTKQHYILVGTGGAARDADTWRIGEKVTVIGECGFLGRTIYPVQVAPAWRVEGFMATSGKTPKKPLPTKKEKPKAS
jgi:hypothetical protein